MPKTTTPKPDNGPHNEPLGSLSSPSGSAFGWLMAGSMVMTAGMLYDVVRAAIFSPDHFTLIWWWSVGLTVIGAGTITIFFWAFGICLFFDWIKRRKPNSGGQT